MSDDPTQSVVTDTNAAAKPAVAGNDAPDQGDDLDKLLSQFDAEAKPAVPPPKPEQTQTDPALKALADRVEGKLSELNAVSYRHDMDKTINEIRGDLDPDLVDDDLVESWLDAQARKDPRLARAWLERSNNPKAFDKVKAELGKSLARKFAKLPDRGATEDRAAVAAAVRGASTRTPEERPANYAGMGNADVKADIEKKYGYTPSF